jgi:hypothetical protein
LTKQNCHSVISARSRAWSEVHEAEGARQGLCAAAGREARAGAAVIRTKRADLYESSIHYLNKNGFYIEGVPPAQQIVV